MIPAVGIILTICIVKSAISIDTHYETGSRHGGTGGVENYKITCPHGGAITGINYRAAARVDQIEFECTSSMGKTLIGPYGGNGGTPGSLRCPPGQYISSFFGRSASKLDRLGIRCRLEGDMKGEGKIAGEFGGMGGSVFDETALSVGARPVSVLVRAFAEVDAIQITYGNTPITGKLCTDCNQYKEEWAPKRGGDGGSPFSFRCPAEGVITGIKYRSASRLDSIEFICTSSLGETNIGPFGGSGGTAGEEKCPPGSYIGSIHGRSASRVDKLGIRCVKYGQVGGSPKRDGHGGEGGQLFDDESFASNGKRPVEIKIRAAAEVDAIQIKYGNTPVALKCKISKMEVTDKTITALDDGYEVIGVAAGSTCSPIQQQLTLQTTQSVTETVGVDTSEGGEFNWATEMSVTFTSGVNLGATSEVSIGLSQTVGGSKSWSRTESKSTTTGSDKTSGTQIGYQGPGACVVVGYMNRYKIERDNLPVLYHFTCEGGSITPQVGKIKLTSNTFGKANFQDFQYKFKNEAACTSAARACVSAVKANKVISDPKLLETEFKKCFK